MLSKTHIASAITVGLGVIITPNNFLLIHIPNSINNLLFFSKIPYKFSIINMAHLNNYFEFFPGLILGSTFPDIDTPKSWVSQCIPFIDDKLRTLGILKHRGLTHNVSGIMIALLLYLLVYNSFMLGFSIGYMVHCIGDMITTKLKIKTNLKNDNILYNLFWIINILLLLLLLIFK